MGYMHINNLYKSQEILAFKNCWALEKIHGTSAHIYWDGKQVNFFSGGEKRDRFVALFDEQYLTEIFQQRMDSGKCTIYGEAYGGKQQGMSKTYGPDLRFIAFDVSIGGCFFSVPQALEFVKPFNLEFVDCALIPSTLEAIDAERDKPSTQAIRNGIDERRIREGVVLRPPFEVTLNNGKRLISKHKRPEFSERKTIPEVDPSKRKIMEDANAIADEWVTPMRLNHVLDKIKGEKDMKLTEKVISAMVEDVTREAEGEIADNKSVRVAIGKRTVTLYKQYLRSMIGNEF